MLISCQGQILCICCCFNVCVCVFLCVLTFGSSYQIADLETQNQANSLLHSLWNG